MKGKGTLLAAFILFQTFVPQAVLSSEPLGQDVATLLQEAEQFYQEREAPEQAERAIEIYHLILELDPLQTEALWKLSRSLHWKGDRSQSKAKKLKAYKEAERHAKAAVLLDAESVGAQLMLGISYAQVAETQGPLKSIALVTRIKKAMDAVLREEPENDVAHHVWGVLYRKLPGLMGGSIKLSIAHLKKAIHENPRRTRHYLELARSLYEEGKKGEALVNLKKLLKIKNPENPPQSFYDRQEAETFLLKLAPIPVKKEQGQSILGTP